jgi:formate hydrogenlyase subunit 4
VIDLLIPIIGVVLLGPLAIVLGLLFEGMSRKLQARMQNRRGPPILQPFYDFIKLFGKEQLVPETSASAIFTLAPIIAAITPIIGSVMTMSVVLFQVPVEGDIILILYLLTIPSLMYAVGGAASGNPFGAIGFSRSITMIIAYEVILILSMALTVFKTEFTLASYSIIQMQESLGTAMVLAYPSMFFAGVAYILCIPAAVAVVPFDVSEAKTEIAHGVLLEYTGSHLALMKLSKMMLSFNLALLATVLFFNHPVLLGWGCVYASMIVRLLMAFAVIFFSATLPSTIFARSKPYQAFRFYWKIPILSVGMSILFVMIGM